MSNFALSFAGNSQVVCPGTGTLNFERTNTFSMFAWIKTTNTGQQIIVDHQNVNAPYTGYALSMTGNVVDVQLISNYGGNNYIDVQCTSGITLTDGNPHLVGFTYDGSSTAAGVKIYVDGVLQTNVVNKDSLSGSIQFSVNFQAGINGGFVGYSGTMEDVYVNTNVLNSTQISNIYNQGLYNQSGGILLWKFDEGSGTSAADSLGSNTGTLGGGSTPTWVSSINPNDVVVASTLHNRTLMGVGA